MRDEAEMKHSEKEKDTLEHEKHFQGHAWVLSSTWYSYTRVIGLPGEGPKIKVEPDFSQSQEGPRSLHFLKIPIYYFKKNDKMTKVYKHDNF